MSRLEIPRKIEIKHLESLRAEFENGTSGDAKASALFAAIRFCFRQEILVPEWAMEAFFNATNAWFSLRAGSLDEAFGTSPVTRIRLAKRRRRRLLQIEIRSRADRLKAAGVPIDWEALAKELGSSRTVLQELYYPSRKIVKKGG